MGLFRGQHYNVSHLADTLGNGFLEAVSNTTIQNIRSNEPFSMRGHFDVASEANSFGHLGRFGWKNQHAKLESFAADAYLNEMGITTPIFDEENLSSGGWLDSDQLHPLPQPRTMAST